jgi:uncharacterized protein
MRCVLNTVVIYDNGLLFALWKLALPISRRRPNMPAMDQRVARPTRRCPMCGKPTLQRFRPFCSKRCADIDLNRWLTGSYAVPVVEEDTSARGEGEGEAS